MTTADGTLSDFGINILEEEIDDAIFQTNQFLTDATFIGQNGPFWWLLVDSTGGYGAGGTVRYHYGCADGLQDDGEAGAA